MIAGTTAGPGIGLLGCGWVAGMQLAAYRDAGYRVTALADRTPDRARALRDAYAPDARVYADLDALLSDDAVGIVDVATHVDGRAALIETALRSGRHVLTQKPFVEDLAEGERLDGLARELGQVLAVNHNGRWAPHFAALLAAASRGDLGNVTSADFSVHWPHESVVKDKPAFAGMVDLVLYDFGIHWFDLIGTLIGDSATAVYAQVGRRPGQRIAAPLQAQVLIEFPAAQVSLVLRAGETRLEEGRYRVDGTKGTFVHSGASLGGERVTSVSGDGPDADVQHTAVGADWFGPGMAGTMGELLAAVAQGRPPSNSAASSMRGLALCFAALESARSGLPVVPGTVRVRPGRSS